jgi:hypothetical protein
MVRPRPLLCLPMLLSFACAHADEFAPVTPYRPSVSTSAQLPQPGQLELELGALASKSDGARRDSLPYQFKIAFNKEWGVLVGGEAAVWTPEQRGVGDTAVVLKHAILVDDANAFGVELGVKLPTAKNGLGSGKSDTTFNTIYSHDFSAVHMDLNLNATRLGAVDPDTGRTQAGASAAFSAPLDEHWGATWEWSGTRRAGTASTGQVLGALTYSPSKQLTVDFGVAKGISGGSDWSLFTGVVMPLAKWW